MNFKALAATAAISLSTVFGAAPQKPRSTIAGSWRLARQGACLPVNRRINANGHKVHDIRHLQRVRRQLRHLLFENPGGYGIAEVFVAGKRIELEYWEDSDGDVRIEMPSGAEFIIRI